MKISYFFISFLSFFLSGCLNEKIEITSEYIKNANWNLKGEKLYDNSIQITKLKVRSDSTIDPFTDLSQSEILDKLEADSTFIWVANIIIQKGESYTGKKVFFDKYNGFDWWSPGGDRKSKIIGKLEKDSWYEISKLSYYYFIVYIDSAEQIHRFVINQANY